MLGAHEKNRCFHIAEIDVMMSNIQAKRQREHKPVSEDMSKTLKYCKRFRPLKNDSNALTVRDQLLRKVDYEVDDGKMRSVKRCREFEATQLINLMPNTVDEAKKLIPTLDGNVFLADLISEIQPMRALDRAIKG